MTFHCLIPVLFGDLVELGSENPVPFDFRKIRITKIPTFQLGRRVARICGKTWTVAGGCGEHRAMDVAGSGRLSSPSPRGTATMPVDVAVVRDVVGREWRQRGLDHAATRGRGRGRGRARGRGGGGGR